MAVISFRDSGLYAGEGSGMQLVVPSITTSSSVTGTMQVRLTGLPYNELTLVTPKQMTGITAGKWAALIDQLRGAVNHLEAHDPGHIRANGSATGSGTSSAAAAQATSLTVSGVSGTLLRGDRMQVGTGVGSHYLHVTADATLPGSVTFEPPLRAAVASGTVVRLDKPSIYCKLIGPAPLWLAAASMDQQIGGVTLKFREQWQ